MESRDPKYLGHHLLPPKVHISRKLEFGIKSRKWCRTQNESPSKWVQISQPLFQCLSCNLHNDENHLLVSVTQQVPKKNGEERTEGKFARSIFIFGQDPFLLALCLPADSTEKTFLPDWHTPPGNSQQELRQELQCWVRREEGWGCMYAPGESPDYSSVNSP